ncbi:LmeA family phospholipid-binding protein [Frankia sp. AgKG'84/4]
MREAVVDTEPVHDAADQPWSEPWSRTGRFTVRSTRAAAPPPDPSSAGAGDGPVATTPVATTPVATTPVATTARRPRWRRSAGPRRPLASGRRLALIAAVVLVAFLAQFVVADRLAVIVAQRAMASQIRSGALADLPCDTTPPTVSDVHIGGFPFLTQVLTGSFSDVGLTMTGLPTTGPRIERISAHAHGIHVPMFRLATGGDGTIRIDDLAATVRMTYADLNAYLATQPGSVHITPLDGGSRLAITATLNIPLFGDQQVGGVTTFAVHNNKVTLVPSQIMLKGLFNLSIPLGNLGQYFPQVAIPVGDLPFELTVTDATTDATGLNLAATAANIETSTADQKPCRPTGG